MYKFLFFLICNTLLFSIKSYSKTFEKSFKGDWASTTWSFEFKKDGSFIRTASGHYGFSKVTGNYILKHDTLQIVSGFEDTDGTVNEFYLIDKDSMLIDLYLTYDYAPLNNENDTLWHHSLIRNVKYPQIETKNISIINELDFVMNLALKSDTLKQLYKFEKYSDRKLIFADYFFLKLNIEIDGKSGYFLPKEKISEKFYIEFENVNQNDNNINFRIILHGEKKYVYCDYEKIDNVWTERNLNVHTYF